MPSWSTLRLGLISEISERWRRWLPRPALGRSQERAFGRVIVADALLLRQPRAEHGDARHPIALVEAHHDHAACFAAVSIDRGDVGAHNLAVLANEEEFLGLLRHHLRPRD